MTEEFWMALIRRVAAVVGTCALAGFVVAGPATAATPEVFAGTADARALDLTVLGQSATFGDTKAAAASTLKTTAEGAGQLAPVLPATPPVKAAVDSDGNADVKPLTCGSGGGLPAPVNTVLAVGLACQSASARVIGGNPVSSSEAYVASVGLSANTLLSGPLAPITGPLQAGLGTILGSLPTGGTPIDPAVTTLEDLVTSVLKTPTLDVSVGKSTSAVTATTGTIVSESTAAGVIIKLLPLPQVSGTPSLEPAATITVGKASATATYDRVAGTSTAKFQPALVSVKFNTALTNGIPALASGIDIAPGLVAPSTPANQAIGPCADDPTSTCILVGTALESRIRVANGRTTTADNGSVTAVADGVRLELLKGVQGGIVLNLAHAQAAVGGSLAIVDLPTANEIPRVDELPRTGGTPVIPLVGAGVLGLAVLVRRTLVKAAR
jgi:hypothetical protein